MKINQVGITEFALPVGAIAIISGNTLELHMGKSVDGYKLPSEPKCTRTELGKMIPIKQTRNRKVFIPFYELAVNAVIPGERLHDIMRRLEKKNKKEIAAAVLDMARFSLLFEDQKQTSEMMRAGKCSWVLKVFRSWPMAIRADGSGNLGACAYQQLLVIGG